MINTLLSIEKYNKIHLTWGYDFANIYVALLDSVCNGCYIEFPHCATDNENTTIVSVLPGES